jgi:hypothetical protein
LRKQLTLLPNVKRSKHVNQWEGLLALKKLLARSVSWQAHCKVLQPEHLSLSMAECKVCEFLNEFDK